MRIIELEALSNGAHRNQKSSTGLFVPEGWAIIPDDMEIPASFPFVDVEVESVVVTKLIAREVLSDNSDSERLERIAELKELLAETDYAIIKIAEGAAKREEYAELIEQREQWRKEIRNLE